MQIVTEPPVRWMLLAAALGTISILLGNMMKQCCQCTLNNFASATNQTSWLGFVLGEEPLPAFWTFVEK